jgi:hypothetical protein
MTGGNVDNHEGVQLENQADRLGIHRLWMKLRLFYVEGGDNNGRIAQRETNRKVSGS